jgi:hypothetical protein
MFLVRGAAARDHNCLRASACFPSEARRVRRVDPIGQYIDANLIHDRHSLNPAL